MFLPFFLCLSPFLPIHLFAHYVPRVHNFFFSIFIPSVHFHSFPPLLPSLLPSFHLPLSSPLPTFISSSHFHLLFPLSSSFPTFLSSSHFFLFSSLHLFLSLPPIPHLLHFPSLFSPSSSSILYRSLLPTSLLLPLALRFLNLCHFLFLSLSFQFFLFLSFPSLPCLYYYVPGSCLERIHSHKWLREQPRH